MSARSAPLNERSWVSYSVERALSDGEEHRAKRVWI